MNTPLPNAVTAFFAASNGAGAADVKHCFAKHASVRDEGQTHHGLDAIEAWLRETQGKFAYTVELLDAVPDGDLLKVRAKVSGNFPGSPAELEHVFGMDGDLIESLEIH